MQTKCLEKNTSKCSHPKIYYGKESPRIPLVSQLHEKANLMPSRVGCFRQSVGGKLHKCGQNIWTGRRTGYVNFLNLTNSITQMPYMIKPNATIQRRLLPPVGRKLHKCVQNIWTGYINFFQLVRNSLQWATSYIALSCTRYLRSIFYNFILFYRNILSVSCCHGWCLHFISDIFLIRSYIIKK